MTSAILVVAFLLGLSIGSFINAWSFRYDTGRSILSPSSCFSCRRNLSWLELVPLLSFVFLRGRCRACKTRISLQYPLVELITGIVFVLVAYRIGSDYPLLIFHLIFWSVLIAIAVYDIREKIIPDGASYFLALFGFLVPMLLGNARDAFEWPRLLAGPILALPFAAFWFFSRGKWMGLGDAKLEFGLGWFLGLALGFSGMLVAFYAGALVGVGLIIAGSVAKRLSFTLKSELPFGPFLVFGAFVAWFFNITMLFLPV